MREDDYLPSLWRRFARKLVAFNKSTFATFLKPLIAISLNASLLGHFKTGARWLQEALRTVFNKEAFSSVIGWLENPLVICFIFCVIGALKLFYLLIEKSAGLAEVGSAEMLAIIENTNKVVDAKSRWVKETLRFQSPDMAKQRSAQLHDEQISLLCTAIKSVFEQLYPTTSIRVTLAKVERGQLTEWRYSDPDGVPRSSVKDLNCPESAASNAIQRGGIYVVASTNTLNFPMRKRPRYVKAKSKNADRSLLCFAVNDNVTGEVIYLLSLTARKSGTFEYNKAEIYEDIISHFTRRICLEHNSFKLRAHTYD
ncbi:hypothetical protein [Candidatus Sororendozoicomonas aggregata]|uniref:hypothetical protein n=1 Tax=Candidatus Sororendozoicomonas aggregata TaxID=3073239 RepID=UPI002ED2AFE8